jgi:hypothetical protein
MYNSIVKQVILCTVKNLILIFLCLYAIVPARRKHPPARLLVYLSSAATMATASRHVPAAATTYSRTKDTPNGKCIGSQQFSVRGYQWRVRYYPNGREDRDTDYVLVPPARRRSWC